MHRLHSTDSSLNTLIPRGSYPLVTALANVKAYHRINPAAKPGQGRKGVHAFRARRYNTTRIHTWNDIVHNFLNDNTGQFSRDGKRVLQKLIL